MKKRILIVFVATLAACASNETQIREALKKNPKIVFDVIEENPQQFIEVVNRAARKAQEESDRKQASDARAEQERDLKDPKQPALDPARRLVGDDSGKIVVVEYADFQCPACAMAYESLKRFKEKHKGEMQFYFKNMPLDFHKMAMPSALYFEAIGLQDRSKALRFYDAVFSNQRELKSEDFLKKIAKKVGADMKRLETDIKSEAVRKIVESDQAEFEKFGFTGTPVVLINGVALNGARPLEELERVVELIRKEGLRAN